MREKNAISVYKLTGSKFPRHNGNQPPVKKKKKKKEKYRLFFSCGIITKCK